MSPRDGLYYDGKTLWPEQGYNLFLLYENKGRWCHWKDPEEYASSYICDITVGKCTVLVPRELL